eukprot:CAMPEP_0183736590 /NCGR_PEP_ID=MMETSP0737-20130205/49644_1 /TAXON_ID=385413 /ORGANISM="Thalassiosira miniscula, Strain CCMP1093" /LENGTH=599 /DNA_ID=CAMNT_0025970633 /DNA_START=158 /DNA_END=1957 /DNA_ORIENTATION=-
MKMGKDAETNEEASPIILEGVGWKRRSGFGKYSDSIGGSSWERRRFTLTAQPAKLSYYQASESSNNSILDETPRGSLHILPERATITATYPAEQSQPTPYALTLKTNDGADKWKFCFDDRETQLIWLVALTDIVAEASVKEYNDRVLTAEVDKSTQSGGFHRLYEEGNGKLLDLVHTALLSGGALGRTKSQRRAENEAIEVVRRSGVGVGAAGADAGDSIRIMSTASNDSTLASSAKTVSPMSSPVATQAREDGNAAFFNQGEQQKEENIPSERLYQALAVVGASIVLERVSEMKSSLFWQFVNVVILFICFYPTKTKEDDKKGKVSNAATTSTSNESNGTQGKRVNFTKEISASKSQVGAQLMKSEGVPLSDMPSFNEKSKGSTATDDTDKESPSTLPQRTEPLTEDEMASHLHERWAQSSPNVDLSGEWTLIADDAFKTEYDAYLKQLGFNGITRRVACGLIARTTELTKQSDNGRSLYLKGTNPKGAWERTLTASGFPDFETQCEKKDGEDYEHEKISIKTADAEDVDAEAWWEEKGSKHRSWLCGGKKYGGGDFESLRYIEEGSEGNVLVCESIFHPKDASKKKAVVTWRFQRDP